MPAFDSPLLYIHAARIAGLLIGCGLLWRFFKGRLGPRQPALPRWSITLEGLVMTLLLILAGAMILPNVVAALDHDLLGPAADDGDWWLAVQGMAFQCGLLGGALVAMIIHHFSARTAESVETPAVERPVRQPMLAGAITFLMALPVITLVHIGWVVFLEGMNLPTGEQPMVELLRNADDPWLLLTILVLAVIVAPVTEELIFRGVLFRYLRTRIPRSIAVVAPALVFALLHANVAAMVPLFVLGVFFALAYERTGRIAVPMIAHALFNLHTIVLVMSGAAG